MQNAVESPATSASPDDASVQPIVGHSSVDNSSGTATRPASRPEEIGGPTGPEPTRYGDWEKKGRCIDF
jgi:hypothetical protein